MRAPPSSFRRNWGAADPRQIKGEGCEKASVLDDFRR